jgi:EAL domain-containing protein (putative c-di-GMP-specific phosphodiesterase class I)/GGDEF domain-containing protein
LLDTAAVPLVVASQTRDPVEALNSLLRRIGIPAHCTWIPGLQDLTDALIQINPEMLVYISQDGAELEMIAKLRDRFAPELPLVVVRPQVDEDVIAQDLAMGARDCVTFNNPTRLQAVVARELRAHRLERALEGTLRSANDYRKQLENVLRRSNDAIAQVQEGILVEANASWLELVGVEEASAITGQPIMDFFEENTHAALKGALIACLQGRWKDHALKVHALLPDGSAVPLDLTLSLGEREGESCVRLVVPAQKRDDRQLAAELADATRRNPRTGLLYRQSLFELIAKRLKTSVQGGCRYLLCIRPDHFSTIERDLGAVESEEFIPAFAHLVKSQLLPNDLLGHYSGTGLMALLERGTQRDAEAWSEHLLDKVSRHDFPLAGKSIKATLTVGMSLVPNVSPRLDAIISDALDAARRGRQRGGNQLCAFDHTDADARVQSYDAVWIKHIKAALMDNRFRLVQQPVASLQGTDTQMFDVLVRMVDTQGKEVLPSEFMPAAERNDLLKNIDRWVIAAAFNFAAKNKPGCLFVRLSRSSALDPTLAAWLDAQLKASLVDPHRICFQVTEEVAASYVQEIRRLASALHERQLRFALEHFGAGRDPLGLIGKLQLDFLKIDGSLMQGLPDDEALQQKVKLIVEAGTAKQIATIAERVEDANTMAVLWQLGVQYLQGYFVQTPEEVVISAK